MRSWNDLAKTMENFVRDEPVYDIESELKDTLAQKAQEIRDKARRSSSSTAVWWDEYFKAITKDPKKEKKP